MGWKAATLEAARRLGVLPLLGSTFGHRLTALAYHRITDAADPDLLGYAGNVSASPESFAAQLDWLQDHFTVIGMNDLLAWFDGAAGLPNPAAMITFDDGYADNLEHAAPLLAERGLPATLFLTTGPTDGGPALHWDLVAWIIEGGRRRSGDIPGFGTRNWSEQRDRRALIHDYVYATKWLPPDRRAASLDDLRDAVDGPAGDRIPGLYLDWDGVRALEGWEIGSHTVHHPVLTSVSEAEATAEIGCSVDRIRTETGRSVRTLAYPNGLSGDYDERVAEAARSVGIDLAFTLRPGPARPQEIIAAPLELRRVYVGFGDRLGVFGGKAMGASRLLGKHR